MNWCSLMPRNPSRPQIETIVIYLPAAQPLPEDLLRWASERLPDIADAIGSVSVGETVCHASTSPEKVPGAAGLFGTIREDWDDSRYCFRVPVVVVKLTPQRVRGAKVGPQWPGGPLEENAATEPAQTS